MSEESGFFFSREMINETFNLKVQKDGSKFKKLLKELEYQKIVDLLTSGKGKWKATRKKPQNLKKCFFFPPYSSCFVTESPVQ